MFQPTFLSSFSGANQSGTISDVWEGGVAQRPIKGTINHDCIGAGVKFSGVENDSLQPNKGDISEMLFLLFFKG